MRFGSARAGGDAADAQLVARVLAGEREAYAWLVSRHQPALFRVARAMVGDADVAEDLVQDALVRAYVNLARCKEPARFRFWLHRTLRNRVLDHLKEKRRRDVSLSDEAVARRAERVRAEAPDPTEAASMEQLVERALARLSLPLREAFVLRHVEQLSVEEVADVLGTGVSAVKMRVHRARQQLREWLEAEAEANSAGPAPEGRAPAGVTPGRLRSS